jgi:hypothetical protein
VLNVELAGYEIDGNMLMGWFRSDPRLLQYGLPQHHQARNGSDGADSGIELLTTHVLTGSEHIPLMGFLKRQRDRWNDVVVSASIGFCRIEISDLHSHDLVGTSHRVPCHSEEGCHIELWMPGSDD